MLNVKYLKFAYFKQLSCTNLTINQYKQSLNNMFESTRTKTQAKLPQAVWGNNIMVFHKTSRSNIFQLQTSPQNEIYKTLCGKITKQLFYLTKQPESICRLNAQVSLSEIRQFKAETYNAIMQYLLIQYEGAQVKYRELKILYMIFFLAKNKEQLLSNQTTQADEKRYLVEWLQQYNLFFHEPNPNFPYTADLPQSRIKKLSNSQIQFLEDLYDNILNYREQILLRIYQSLIQDNTFSQDLKQRVEMTYCTVYGRALNKYLNATTNSERDKNEEDAKRQIQRAFGIDSPFEKQISLLLKLQIQLILFKDKLLIRKLSKNSWAQYLKLHLVYVLSDNQLSKRGKTIQQFLQFKKIKNLPAFQNYFIEEIGQKNRFLGVQEIKQINFRKMYLFLPAYLCALIGFKCCVKDICKETISFGFSISKDYINSLQKQAFNQAPSMGWQTLIYMLGIYRINRYRDNQESQQIYNALLSFISYDQIESEEQLAELQQKLMDLFEVDLDHYAIKFIQNMIQLHSKRNIGFFTFKLLLLYLRLTLTRDKNNQFVKHYIRAIQQYIEVESFDYTLLDNIQMLEQQLKTNMQNQNNKKFNYAKYKCQETDLKGLLMIKKLLAPFFDIKAVLMEQDQAHAIEKAMLLLQKRFNLDVTWQLFRLLITIFDKNIYHQFKQVHYPTSTKTAQMVDQSHQLGNYQPQNKITTNSMLGEDLINKVKIFIYKTENKGKISKQIRKQTQQLYRKLKFYVYDRQLY